MVVKKIKKSPTKKVISLGKNIKEEPVAVDFSKMDGKWQRAWEKEKAFVAKEEKGKKKFYVLEMYPYPSGSGLHMGHAFNYTVGDIFARFKKMQGFNVLHPMGYDSFGLPAENAAIKAQTHPKKYTDEAIENFIRQQKALGLTYDWSRRIQSHDPKYYKWNQYFFLQFLKNGLVYRKESPVNWCGKCNSVLANEQVHNGRCWRHEDTEIQIKSLEQWFIKTTKYADEIVREVVKLDWPERIKIMQENWIGRSEGTEIEFTINGKKWPIFTTRPDTLFGVTFLVVSAQHPKLMELFSKDQKKSVEEYVKKIKSTKQEDIDKMNKDGVFTGAYAVHPLTGDKVPVWAGNFVLAEYGSGMVMAVPAHDQRDFDFAKKYKIPVKVVIQPKEDKNLSSNTLKEAYTGAGTLINSEEFNDLASEEAKVHITKALEMKKLGKAVVNFKLRDWLVSRQRYWGTPIPIVYCDKCGAVPVPEKELPVLLPEKVTFGKGNPLASSSEFVNTKCPTCKGKARRETDTMDTFMDSSWYYLRFADAGNADKPFDAKKEEYWMPVDFYTGGAEHACMHLIYARFFTKALRDLGYVHCGEPFKRLFNQGMIHGEDGVVMSKSRGNTVDPLDMTKKYGADALRLFLVSMASPDKDFAWSSTALEGSWKFVSKVYQYSKSVKFGKSSPKVEHKLNKAIKDIGQYIEDMKYNLAVITLRGAFESFEPEMAKSDFASYVKLFSVFCPHVAEEIWSGLGNNGFVSHADWPVADEKKINDSFDQAEKALEKIVGDILNILKIVREKEGKEPESVYLYVIPPELKNYDAEALSKRITKQVKVFVVNDPKKYDPEGKASKAKFGKPGIFVE